jgi:hypothetical protein
MVNAARPAAGNGESATFVGSGPLAAGGSQGAVGVSRMSWSANTPANHRTTLMRARAASPHSAGAASRAACIHRTRVRVTSASHPSIAAQRFVEGSSKGEPPIGGKIRRTILDESDLVPELSE